MKCAALCPDPALRRVWRRNDFAFAENATIRQIKELMVKYYPYPINIDSIVMDDHGAVLKDDTLLFDIVSLWMLSDV